MVAVVSGNSLGLSLTSLSTLGQNGVIGQSAQGRNGEQVYVNLSNGNLVIQDRDDALVEPNIDSIALRTYNSEGNLTDDNADNWSNGIYTPQLQVVGGINAAGSSVLRTDADGAQATFNYDAASKTYISTDGAGAYDTIAYNRATGQFTFTDGSTRVAETYQAGGKGHLLTRTDADGNSWQFIYKGNTNVVTQVKSSWNKEVTNYEYSGTQLTRVSVTLSDGTVLSRTSYQYDTAGRLCEVVVDLTPADGSIADGDVYTTRYAYEGTSTRIAEIDQADGTSLKFSYVQIGSQYRVASVTDAAGQTTRYNYDVPNNRTYVTDALGNTTRYDYDAKGQLTGITGAAHESRFTYNANGDLTQVVDGEGRTIDMAYDGRGNQVLQRDALGNTIARTYNAANQLVTQSVYTVPDPDGAGAQQPAAPLVTRYVYDSAVPNRLRFVISPEGRVTEYRYNSSNGLRTSSVQYDGSRYDTSTLADGTAPTLAQMAQWQTAQDASAATRIDYGYDFRGQLQAQTTWTTLDAAGNGVADGTQSVVRYTYDQAGQLLSTTDANGGQTIYAYDGLGRLLSVTNALGQTTTTSWDDQNNRTTVSQANGLVTTSAYDRAGRLVSVTQSGTGVASSTTTYSYDADGRLVMTQDPTGVRHWMLYDGDGRKVADIDGNGSLVESVYDKSDRVIQTIAYATKVDVNQLVTSTGAPSLVPLSAIRPTAATGDSRNWHIYDAAGRLAETVNASGAVTQNVYDGASRLVEVIAYANAISTAGLSAQPQLADVNPVPDANADRVTRNFYSQDGLLLARLDGEGELTEYRYDNEGRLVQTVGYATNTDPALRATGTLDQLRPAASAADQVTTLLLDRQGRVVGQVDPEGDLTETVYDRNGNVTQTIQYGGKVQGAVTPATSLADIRPAAQAEDRSTTRSYDGLNRLTQERDPQGTVTTYTYDIAGKLVSTVRAIGAPESRSLLARFDVLGRVVAELTAEGAQRIALGDDMEATWAAYSTRYTYDAAGRRTSAADPNGLSTLYYYDVDGHLTYTVNAAGEVSESRYDALGRLQSVVQYGARIATSGLAGGLDATALQTALSGISQITVASYIYDATGTLRTETDALGHVSAHRYNAFGEETGRTDAIGANVTVDTVIQRDRRGLATQVTQDVGGINATVEQDRDAFGRVIRSVDANGNVRTQSYDRLGRVVTTTDALGSVRTTSYDAFGRTLTQTDALGHVTSYSYDRANRTMTVTSPEGVAVTTQYDRLGQTVSVTDGLGNTTRYAYDADGQLKTTTDAAGNVATSSYDHAGRLTQSMDAQGHVVAYTYDAVNRLLTRTVDPASLNLATTYTYDAQGRQIQVVDASGRATQFVYDAKGQLTAQIVDPNGLALRTGYTYDAQGRTLTVTDPAGCVTRYDYDKLGRRVAETVDPSGLQIARRYTYDAQGNVTAVTDPNGNVTRYAYDAEGRAVFTMDATGAVRENVYDAQGRIATAQTYRDPIAAASLGLQPTLAAVRAALGTGAVVQQAMHNVWDTDGRLHATVDQRGEVVKYTFDAAGNVIERVAYANADLDWRPGLEPNPTPSAQDQRVRTVYDALNRPIYTIDGTGALVAQQYDADGNLLARIAYATPVDPATPATQVSLAAAAAAVLDSAHDARALQVYDQANRLVWSENGLGAVTHYNYDGAGHLLQRVDYASPVTPGADPSTVVASAGDRVTSYAYDQAGRQAFTIDPMGSVQETVYDAAGNVVRQTLHATRVATPVAGTTYTVGQLRSLGSNSADRSTRMAYDAAGRAVFTIDAGGAVSEAAYDPDGNVARQTRYAKPISGIVADGASVDQVRALVTPDAQHDRVERRVYDGQGRLTYAADALGYVTQSVYDALGQLVRSVQYDTPVSAGQGPGTVASTPRDRVTSYAYDTAGRLVATTDALGQQKQYTYDAVGNRLTFTNEKGDTWTYTYDAEGRMVQETSPQVSLTTTSTWVGTDGSEHLAQGATVQAAVVTRMSYDALGNLRTRTEAAGRSEERTTTYTYDAVGHQIRTDFPAVAAYSGGDPSSATRNDQLTQLYTETTYDVFGDAIANRNVAGASSYTSYKAYDKSGAVIWDVDAAGYVTGYQRDNFGQVQRLTRYAAQTNLTAGEPLAHTAAEIAAAVNAPGVDHSADRTLDTQYDRLGRAVQVTESAVFSYDSSASSQRRYLSTGKVTRTAYDAFGDATQVSQLRNDQTNTWLTESRYYDGRGQQVATVDAGGYLTTQAYDAAGNVVARTEFANVIAGWNPAQPGTGVPATQADPNTDRTTYTAYDALNRKIGDTRSNVEYTAPGATASTRGNLTTTYAYDAVGNLVATTDPVGATTYSYYDALGRVLAIAQPTRTGATVGAQLTPLTEFLRDAYGNVVVTIQRASGANSVSASNYTATASDQDRITRTAYDNAGHATLTVDANGAEHYSSYDARGKLAKQWQRVTGVDGVTRNLFQVFQYDAVGQQTHRIEAGAATLGGPNGTTPVDGGLVDTETDYNAFGEVTAHKVDGAQVEYFKYDNAGRVWMTNASTGADRIELYDLQGNNTAELTSNGDITIATLPSAQYAAQDVGGLRRTAQIYDALGHVTQQIQPQRTQAQGGVTVSRNYLQASIQSSSTIEDESGGLWAGENSISLSWSSLAGLGSGDVMVQVTYATLPAPTTTTSDESSSTATVVTAGPVETRSFQVADNQRDTGGFFTWTDSGYSTENGAYTNPGGVSQILQVTVYKKDLHGDYQQIFNQAAQGYGSNTIDVAAPVDPSATAQLLVRPAGGTDAQWQLVPVINFGHALRADASTLPLGSYEYQLLVAPVGATAPETAATGSFTLTPTPLAAIPNPVTFMPPATIFGVPAGAAPGVLTWQSPASGVVQVMRIHPLNGGDWSSYAVSTMSDGTSELDVSGLAGGGYEYELLWSEPLAAPFAHATGQFTVTPAVPATYVPPENLPPIAVNVIGATAGGIVIGQDENGPIYLRDSNGNIVGGTGQNQLEWINPGYEAHLYYRPYGSTGAWSEQTGIVSQTADTESAAGTYQTVSVDNLPAGDYQYWLTFDWPGQGHVAQALGHLTIQPGGGGHYVQQQVQVQVPVTVTPADPSNYIVGYTGTDVVYGPPVVVGYDESNQPIFGDHYGRNVIGQDQWGQPIYGPVVAIPYTQTVTTTQLQPVQVQVAVQVPVYETTEQPVYETVTGTREVQVQQVVGQEPLMLTDESGNQYPATDESGNIIYVDVYETVTVEETYTYQVQVGTQEVQTLVGYTTEYQTQTQMQEVTTTTQVTVTPPPPSDYIVSGSANTPVYGYPVVVGYDESGVPMYGTGYGEVNGQVVAIPYTSLQTQTVTQNVWVPDAIPQPTIADETPPYVPGYTKPPVPAQYSVSDDSNPGTLSISGMQGVDSSQAAGLNGETDVLTPTITRTTDRWGNVTSITDARNGAWTTAYRYDANNHMVEQMQPDGGGNNGALDTKIYYDQDGNQVGVLDANGHLNRQVYDAGGNLVQEIHADGGVVNYSYNAFGERVQTQDALGNITQYGYDALGRQAAVIRLGQGGQGFNVYATGMGADYEYGSNGLGVRLARTGAIVETTQYDAAGEKIHEVNGNGEWTSYLYDQRGNVVQVTKSNVVQQTSAYDNQGHVIKQVDALGASATWSYDYFGEVKTHTNIGGVSFAYTYDAARQLVRQDSSTGQVLTWSYDSAGQMVRALDQEPTGGAYGWKQTEYAYDAAGHKIRETTTQDGIVYQDDVTAYDALGRIRWVGDSRAFVDFTYDAVGNRTLIHTHVNNPNVAHDDQRYYAYDAMNRQTLVDAQDAAGNLGPNGHRLTYDLEGNRASDTYVGEKIIALDQTITGYDESSGAVIYSNPYTIYSDGGQGEVTEQYGYDGMGRLKSVLRDGVQTDLRLYDAAGRVLFTGPKTALPASYFKIANGIHTTGQPLPGIGTETHISQYDSQGRLLYMRVLQDSDNMLFHGGTPELADKAVVDYTGGYDAAGNLLRYSTTDIKGEVVNTYTTQLTAYEGYKEAVVSATSNKLQPGQTIDHYDASGYLVAVDDTTKDANDRRFVNDSSGQVLAVNQGGNILRQLIVGGEVMARYGIAPGALQPKDQDGNPRMVDTADFLFGYRPISPEYPTAAPGSYLVASGDTLKSIAQSAYGDASLWFKVADANGLSSDADLRVGQTLTLPNIVTGSSNAAGTFQPYDPSKVVGDTSPNLPVPHPKHSWFGTLLAIIVVIIVTVYTAGTMTAAANASFAQIMSTGASVLTGTGAGAAAAASSSLGIFGVAAVAGAAGSIAGQLVGIATGAQDSFSWKGVALNALSAGVTAGIGSAATGALAGDGFRAVVARAAIGNALTQGIGVATGLQKSFDWRGVAASAVGAGVGQQESEALGMNTRAFQTADFSEQVGKRLLSGLAAGVAAAAAHGGKVAVQQVAVDAFGNALGQGLVDAANSPSTTDSFSAAVARQKAANNPFNLPTRSGDVDLQKLFSTSFDDTELFLNTRGSGEVLGAGPGGVPANPFRGQAQSAITGYWDTALTASGPGRADLLEQKLGTIRGLLNDVRKDPTYIAAELRNVARMANGEAGLVGQFFAGHDTVDGVVMPSRIEVAAGSVLTGDALTFGSLMSPVGNAAMGMRSNSNAMGGMLAMLSLGDPDLVINNLRSMANQQVLAPGGVQMYAYDFAMRRDTSSAVAMVLGSPAAMAAGDAAVGLISRTAQGALASIRAADVRLNPFMPERALSRGNPAAISSAPGGVVYLRTDRSGNLAPYGGQANSEARYLQRQQEHARDYPDADFDFVIVRRAQPGVALDIAEHNFIQELTGGVAARKSPLVSNKVDPMGVARRALYGLPEPRTYP